MSKEIKVFLDYLSSQTGMELADVAREMELALETVVAKNPQYEEEARIKVQIQPEDGQLEIYRIWKIVDDKQEVIHPAHEIRLEDALKLSTEAAVDEEIFESLPIDGLGRIAAAQAKQLFHRILREGQLEKQKQQFAGRINEVIHAKVKRTTSQYILVELSENADGIIYRQECIPREVYRPDDKIKALIIGTECDYRGAAAELSRTSKEFLRQLFTTEVPEISEGSIEIMSIARDPGSRAKIAVKSNDKRIDPIGACIGMRGIRVRAVSDELHGERVDIILWDEDPVKMAINALSPGEIQRITVDEESKTMDIEVANDQLAQIIGRNGQNIKLASELLQWTLNIKKDTDNNHDNALQGLCDELDIDRDIAEILVRENYRTALTISQASPEQLSTIEEFDNDIAHALWQRAQDRLLESTLNSQASTSELIGFGDLTLEQAEQLQKQGIQTSDELAELAVDELQAIVTMNAERAAELIMLARKPWFENNSNQD